MPSENHAEIFFISLLREYVDIQLRNKILEYPQALLTWSLNAVTSQVEENTSTERRKLDCEKNAVFDRVEKIGGLTKQKNGNQSQLRKQSETFPADSTYSAVGMSCNIQVKLDPVNSPLKTQLVS